MIDKVSLPKIIDCTITNESYDGYVYDVEIYPNFFCVTFINNNKTNVFEISERKNDYESLINFIKEIKVVVGYNNDKFDDYVIGFLKKNYHSFINKDYESLCNLLFDISQDTIRYYTRRPEDKEERIELEKKVRGLKRYNQFQSIDLMKVYNIHKSLKLVAVSLKWHNIQDLPYPFNTNLDSSKIDVVIEYNKNDVLITYELLKNLHKEIILRYNLSILYNVNVLSESDSGVCNILITKMYQEKASDKNFSDKRSYKKTIHLSNCIFKDVKFKSQEFNTLLNNIKSISINKTKDGFDFNKHKVTYKNKDYIIGVGGLHSNDSGNIYESNENLYVIDSDVTSYYPSIMIFKNIKPSHLELCFTDILKELTNERIQAKKSGDKTKADGLKIVINSIFGKLGYEGFFLYDDQAMFKVTLNGQFYLLMLIEMLNEKQFEVISANTDGILTLVPKEKLELYKSICKEWESKLGFNLEYTYYKKYIRRDVNNYLAIDTNNDMKSKGCFLDYIDYRKGYDSPIISIALKEYFVNKKSIESTIKNHKDVYDFCIAQKIGSQYDVYYDTKPVQQSVRYYVSLNGKKLVKTKSVKKENINLIDDLIEEEEKESSGELVAGKLVTLFNQYEKKEDYKIDYNYYIIQANKIIKQVRKEIDVLW
jgi:DNA polymerase elongation subunit (family B)